MASATQQTPDSRSPLERFVRDYVEQEGGAWDEIEPQVYDVLLPTGAPQGPCEPSGRGIMRVTFDPEALPEHPGAQLASFGTPLVDGLLKEALHCGSCASGYLVGLNLAPHDLAARVRRTLRLPEGHTLDLGRVRPLWFAQAVFWFEATFVSDQKEQEILVVGMDLASGREVRHLDRLLDFERLSQRPPQELVEARREDLAVAYREARQQVVRTLASLANARRRELSQRLERQIRRMDTYYADLRSELDVQIERARHRSEDLEKFAPRRAALQREEQLRVAELRQKSALRVELRLDNLLIVRQPKLRLFAAINRPGPPPAVTALEPVWDPLTETLEAPPCPQCGAPTYIFQSAGSHLACPSCIDSPAPGTPPKPRRLRS